MNLLPISDLAARSGFFDLFLIGCVIFYVASRVIRQEWGTTQANQLRSVVAWTFYVFGVILLVTSLSRMPGCEKNERQQPQVEQNKIPGAKTVPGQKTKMPDNKENQ